MAEGYVRLCMTRIIHPHVGRAPEVANDPFRDGCRQMRHRLGFLNVKGQVRRMLGKSLKSLVGRG